VPELEDLKLTIAAATAGTFGAVARDHHVSQSTVSRSVQRVERSLGRPLFARSGRSVELQSDAVAVIEQLRGLVDQWNEILSAVQTRTQDELSIFCTVTASQLIAPRLLEAFRLRCPGVHLELRTGPAGSAVDAVASGDADTAIAPLPTHLPRGLVGAAIETSPFVAVAPLHITSFNGNAVIVSRQGLIRDLAERWVRKALPIDTLIRDADTNEEVLALAALGSGIALIPELVLRASPLKPRVHVLPTEVQLPTVTVGLVARRRDVATKPLADLWNLVVKTEMPGGTSEPPR
jgi:LysR family transcriptional regulator, positive regulator for ilvC